MVILPWEKTKIKRLRIDPVIKSVHIGFRDQSIKIMSIQSQFPAQSYKLLNGTSLIPIG